MCREILFRGKRKDNGEWAEGYYRADPDLDRHFICGWNYYPSGDGLEREPFEYEIDSKTLCQYTGLPDRKKQKIWEHDIVKNRKRKEECDLYKVVWRKDFADFGVEPIKPKFEAKYPMGLSKDVTVYGYDYEVVGNAFDDFQEEANERI